MAISRRKRTYGAIHESVIIAISGGALLAQAGGSAVQDGSLMGMATAWGIPGALLFLLSHSEQRATSREKAWGEEKSQLTKSFADEIAKMHQAQAEQTERLLSTVIGLVPVPAEKGSRK